MSAPDVAPAYYHPVFDFALASARYPAASASASAAETPKTYVLPPGELGPSFFGGVTAEVERERTEPRPAYKKYDQEQCVQMSAVNREAPVREYESSDSESEYGYGFRDYQPAPAPQPVVINNPPPQPVAPKARGRRARNPKAATPKAAAPKAQTAAPKPKAAAPKPKVAAPKPNAAPRAKAPKAKAAVKTNPKGQAEAAADPKGKGKAEVPAKPTGKRKGASTADDTAPPAKRRCTAESGPSASSMANTVASHAGPSTSCAGPSASKSAEEADARLARELDASYNRPSTRRTLSLAA